MDENTRKAIEEVGQKAAADLQKAVLEINQKAAADLQKAVLEINQKAASDLQRAVESINQKLDEESRERAKVLKEMGEILRDMARLPGAKETHESNEKEEAQYRTSKGKEVCVNKGKTSQMPGQNSGTMLETKVQGAGQTHGGPFILRPAHSFLPFSTTPRAYTFPQQQYQQFQYPRNPTLPITAKIIPNTFQPRGPMHQGFRSFQNPQPKAGFTPLPMPYAHIYAQLREQGLPAPVIIEPVKGPPFPRRYNPGESCDYHNGAIGHDIENCVALKRKVEHLLKKGLIAFDNPSQTPQYPGTYR